MCFISEATVFTWQEKNTRNPWTQDSYITANPSTACTNYPIPHLTYSSLLPTHITRNTHQAFPSPLLHHCPIPHPLHTDKLPSPFRPGIITHVHVPPSPRATQSQLSPRLSIPPTWIITARDVCPRPRGHPINGPGRVWPCILWLRPIKAAPRAVVLASVVIFNRRGLGKRRCGIPREAVCCAGHSLMA